MNHRYVVNLTPEEIIQLQELGRKRRVSKRTLQRSQILLAADQGVSHDVIATTIGVGTATVYRTKMHFVQDGLERALSEAPRPGAQRKLDVGEESLLIALACSEAPAGASCWTLHLLADQMVVLTDHDSISDATIARRLDEVRIKPWQHKMWCIPNVDAEFVACMEDVLTLYAKPADLARPVVSFDKPHGNSLAKPGCRFVQRRGSPSDPTTNINAMAPLMCSCLSTQIEAGDTRKSQNVEPISISRTA